MRFDREALRRRAQANRVTAPVANRWSRLPLRARLVGIMVVLLFIALALTGAGTTFVLKRFLVGQVDQDLRDDADRILTAAQSASGLGGGPGLPSRYVVLIAREGQNPDLITGTEESDGTETSTSGALPRFPTMTTREVEAHNGELFTVDSNNHGVHYRVIAYAITPQFGGGGQSVGYALIALPLTQVEDAIKQVEIIFLSLGAVLALLSALFGWIAIRQALAPLVEVEETAAAIAAGDLSQRVPERPSSTEVGRLTTSLNGMLTQIESAFRAREASESRTRRFAADASHELRTPLASIRGFAELYRQGAVREEEDVARTMGRIEDEARRMGGLVEDLLMLARLDEQRPVRSEPVDLLVLAGDATHDARGLAPDRTVSLVGLTANSGPASAVVTGDDARLRQVVSNLVANAVRHTPAGTPIELAVGRAGAIAVLEIRDHGPGLEPEHAVKVFERFYRVDASRARSQGGGSGLGLSIVAAVVSVHGGRVGVAPTPGGGATFRVELPLRPAEDRPEDDASL
ncbi:ATP-binding protein [Spongisporangium articulatum]|uniref:histidine kinase n=1 Tax=Spongisporangium articulatum TaxID=3362603 RepID=A0ABW8AJH4_9ACTN